MENSLMKNDVDENMFINKEDSDDDFPDELFETNDEPEMPKLEMYSAQSTDHDSKKRKMPKLEM